MITHRPPTDSAVAMLNGWTYEGDGGAFTFAARLRGEDRIASCAFYLQQPDPFGHFIYLVKAIDSMMQSGHAAYPVERTLLTTGLTAAGVESLYQKGARVDTPHLAIKYQPTKESTFWRT